MNNDKEKRVEDILNSMKGRTEVPVNPFLYEKVMFRMQQKETAGERAYSTTIFKWAAVLALLVVINGITIIGNATRQHMANSTHQHGDLIELESPSSYNY